jgi:hypothetical protein
LTVGAGDGQGKGEPMKRIDNNEEANNILANIHLAIDNKIRAIYNSGYLQGYKDATEETLQNIKDEILEKKFVPKESEE